MVPREEDTFCIVGRNALGDIVATQAARLYHWDGTTFHDEAESLRLFYADPAALKRRSEAVEVTAPAARRITGRVVFAGGAWYRPDFRGRQLAQILTRISRAYAYTRWQHDYHTSIMAEEVCRGGMPERSGYTKVDWEVMLKRTIVHPEGDVRCALTSGWSQASFLAALPTSWRGLTRRLMSGSTSDVHRTMLDVPSPTNGSSSRR